MVILCLLVGGGTDGASVNVGVHSGLKTRVQHALPWVYWSWCYTHRLELACKDAFTSPFFTSISEMLMRLYYVYEKSAKKIPRTFIRVGTFCSLTNSPLVAAKAVLFIYLFCQSLHNTLLNSCRNLRSLM